MIYMFIRCPVVMKNMKNVVDCAVYTATTLFARPKSSPPSYMYVLSMSGIILKDWAH